MSSSPRRPAPTPLIQRQYDPSRFQHDSLVGAYERLIPITSRHLGAPHIYCGDHCRNNGRVREPRSLGAGV